MSIEIPYDHLELVIESWEKLRRMEDYVTVLGKHIFTHLFDGEPLIKALYGFKKDDDTSNFSETALFKEKSTLMLQLLDTGLYEIGVDPEFMENELTELGRKHEYYGVELEMYPVMGRSLIMALKEVLGEEYFTKDLEHAWREVYNYFMFGMTKDQKVPLYHNH